MFRQYVSVTLITLVAVMLFTSLTVSVVDNSRNTYVLGESDDSSGPSSSVPEEETKIDNSGPGSFSSSSTTSNDSEDSHDDEIESDDFSTSVTNTDATSRSGSNSGSSSSFDDSNTTTDSSSNDDDFDDDVDEDDDESDDDSSRVNTQIKVVDRLSSVDSSTRNCILQRLGREKYEKFRYEVADSRSDEEDINELREKASICFGSFSEISSINQASSFLAEIDEDEEKCLVNALGEDEYEEIIQDGRKVTKSEKIRSRSCFDDSGFSEINFQTSTNEVKDDVKGCLLLALGDERYDLIEDGNATPSFDERKKIERCFGAKVKPFTDSTVYTISSDTDRCLENKLGLGRYTQIKTGHFQPSIEEVEDSSECFEDINSTQKVFLPPPPVQVPFLEENEDIVSIESINELPDENGDVSGGSPVLLSGKGPRNTVIEIYIFSEPIVVTTQTDENGDWVYELTDPLSGESHVAYATVKGASTGNYVRSSVVNFDVLASDSILEDTFLTEDQATDATDRFLYISIALMAAGVIVVAGGLTYGYISTSKEKSSY